MVDLTKIRTPEHIFVYGTLRRCCSMHYRMGLDQATKYVGPGFLRGEMYDCGEYPGIRVRYGSDPDGPWIRGDLLRITDEDVIPALDCYEGYSKEDPAGSLYKRTWCFVAGRQGGSVRIRSWVYEYNKQFSDKPIVKSGDWITYETDRKLANCSD